MDSLDSYRISVPGSTQVLSLESLGFRVRGSHPLWLAFPHHSTNLKSSVSVLAEPYNPPTASCKGLGCSHFARHYFGNLFFSSGYLDVSVPQVPLAYLFFQYAILEVRSSGFPHSDIPGSALVHSYPRLFAVTYVLHRHLAPRHPP